MATFSGGRLSGNFYDSRQIEQFGFEIVLHVLNGRLDHSCRQRAQGSLTGSP